MFVFVSVLDYSDEVTLKTLTTNNKIKSAY